VPVLCQASWYRATQSRQEATWHLQMGHTVWPSRYATSLPCSSDDVHSQCIRESRSLLWAEQGTCSLRS
jgi:hypothetical protein